MELADLWKLVGAPRKVLLIRDYPHEPILKGYLLRMSETLLLLHQFHDFYPEGYAALLRSDVRKARSGQDERFWHCMLAGEGIFRRVGISYEVPLDDFPGLLRYLRDQGRLVTVDCESVDSPAEDASYFGRIIALDESSVTLKEFSVRGRWWEEPSVVPFSAITKVQFDTPYLNTYARYLEPFPGPAE